MACALLTFIVATTAAVRTQTMPQYVGSQSCRRCHAPTCERWAKTRMANVVRDPKEHPDAVLPDLSKSDPLLTFKLSDVAFVYGSKWKQRYFTRVGNDVRSHTFRFITPGDSERLKVPNACVGCHADKNNAWASEQLKRWPELSPWRVASREDGSRINPGTSFSAPRRVP